MLKKTLALLMTLVMVFQVLPLSVMAEGETAAAQSELQTIMANPIKLTLSDDTRQDEALAADPAEGEAEEAPADEPSDEEGDIAVAEDGKSEEIAVSEDDKSEEVAVEEANAADSVDGVVQLLAVENDVGPVRAGDQPVYITVTFDPTTDPNEPLAPDTIEVAQGEPIGSQLLDVPEVYGYRTKWVKQGTSEEVTADTVVDEPFTAVVDQSEKIVYTVTFVQEDGTEETRTTSIDNGFAVNNLPEVAPKTNSIGKWVYPETTNEFTVGTVVTENVTVNAYYEQNIFTVKFMVDNAQVSEQTTATGTTIVLPSDPIKTGATFIGWFTQPNGQGTQYTASSTVNEDLTLYAYFADQVRVSFLVKDDQGNVISEKSQYFVDFTAGDQITTLPDDPFVEGKVFDHWEHETNGDAVAVGYTVTETFNAVAVFKDIDTYTLTVNYFYINGRGDRIDIGTQVYELIENDFPYTVTAPGFTPTDEYTTDPVYYPSQPTITVTKAVFENGSYTVEDEYVAADASYTVKHYLNGLNGGSAELIESIDKVGVKNSSVTPDYNSYAYADPDHRDENVTLTGAAGQVLNVYYNRKDFTLSYNVGGGDYIEAVTAPYGTNVTLPSSATRAGYTFAGWYKDSDYTQAASSPFALEENTTLYAKWNAAQVDYKIVYMVENANDDDYSYLATVTKRAETGSRITMDAQTAGANGTRPSELDTVNFTFKDSTTETVLADGTTVVTVRYSRNVYTLQGRNGNSNVNNARVTAKYGADITTDWGRTFGNGGNAQYSWSYNNQNNSKFKSLTIMPSLSVRTNNSPANTIYLYRHGDTADYHQHLEYWLQNYTEGDATTTYNGKTYGRVKSIDMRYNYLSATDDWYEITGYTKAGYTATSSETENGTYNSFTYSWGTNFSSYRNYNWGWHYYATYTRFNFYYDAEEYPLTFYNYDGTLISTQDVTLGNDISGYLTSEKPDAPMEGATWLGWYTDQEHTSLYSGGTRMPAGLVLYAAFEFPTRTVTYDSQGGSPVEAETDEYGFYAAMPEDPVKDHYTFQGWFTAADESGSYYDWNQPVTEDITLYAHWTQNTISYIVHYYEKGTTTSVLPDKTVSDPAFTENQQVTENAPTVSGHVPDEATKTLNLSFDEEENVITFYYDVIPNEITYTVNYVLRDHPEIKVAKSKTVTVPGTTTNALEMAVEVDTDYLATQTSDADILGQHYKPVETSKELQLALENNVITFEYIPYTTTKITVNYLDMDGNEIEDPDTTYVEKGDTFTVQNKAPEGFVYHHAYLDGTTTAPQPTYQITGNEGNLVINIYYQKKLIILANNKAKAYDGTALFSDPSITADYTVTGITRGDAVTSIEFEGSQIEAGTSSTTPKNAVITLGTTGTTAPEQYYSIIYVPGSLTVKPVSVYINISADQWNTHAGDGGPNYYTGQTFNVGFTNLGKQHFNDAAGSAYINITSGQRDLFKAKYGDAIWNALYGTDGTLISEKDTGTYKVAGSQIRAMVAGVTVDGKAMMSDPNYSITLYARESFLKIDPLPLTITTPSDEKVYDGTELTKSEGATLDHSYWTANIGGTWTTAATAAPGSVTLGTGDTITFNVTGSQTPVGTSDNTYSIEWGTAKSSNYKITATIGTLEVTEATLKITVKDATKTYNGDEQQGYTIASVTGTGSTIETAEYKVEGLAEGDILTITGYSPASGTHAATYTNGSFENAEISIKSGDIDVTGSYTVEEKNVGKLTIEPAKLTITTESAEKIYDGTELKANGTISGFVTPDGGEQETAAFTVTGTQTLVGSSENTYTLSWDGTALESDYTLSETIGTLTVTEPTDPSLVVTKDDGKSTDYKYAEGETVTFTITVKNIYAEAKSITLSEIEGVTLVDTSFTDVAAGATVTTTATYTISPADMAAGSFTNTATATLNGKNYEASDTVNTEEVEAEIEVTKTADKKSNVKVGDIVTYSVVVKNIGNVTVTGIALGDTLVDVTEEAAFDLASGKSKTITYTYTVTQADFEKGYIDNTASANGKDPKGQEVEDEDNEHVEAGETEAKLSITKEAAPSADAEVGTVVTYTVVVKNDGDVKVNEIQLEDTLVTLNEAAFALGVGESKTIKYEYTVTQADFDAGKVENTVTASGKAERGDDPEDVSDDATVTMGDTSAELSITKEAEPTADAKTGDTVTYTVVVTNVGDVKVNGITLSDTLVDLDEEAFDLAVGESKTITYTYTVTQDDFDAGQVDNTVTAGGEAERGDDPEDVSDDAAVSMGDTSAELSITKEAEPTEDATTGDTVTYTVVVTNVGDVKVNGITLSDTLVDLDEEAFDLAVGESKTITYTYTVTQDDFDAGQVDNTVTASGEAERGDDPEDVSDDATVTMGDTSAELSITKEAEPNEDAKTGDTVTYTVVVTNVGDVKVNGITLSDTLVSIPDTFDLAVGEIKTITYNYTVTQDDFDAGQVDNTVTASGTAARGDDPEDVSDDATVTMGDTSAELSITKEASPDTVDEAGAVITYKVIVKNEGDVTVKGGTLTDDHADLSAETFELAPGQEASFEYTYEVTQDDMDAGQIVNVVKAEATAARGTDPEPVTASATVDVEMDGHLTIEKITTSEPAKTEGYDLDEKITYQITVTNDGNLTITGITVSDELTGDTWDIESLAPGKSVQFEASYTVTEEDILAGEVLNVATATGTSPDPDEPEVPVTPGEDPEPTVDPDGHLTVDKITTSEPEKTEGYGLGEEITYQITVTNDGNLTITGITVSDELTGDTWDVESLAPGKSVQFEASYTVTEEDILAGEVLNVATATGTSPDPEVPEVPVTPGEDPEPTEDPNGHLTVDKITTSEPEKTEGYGLGEEITYQITVTNDGNLTITGITVSDELTGDTWDVEFLAPGKSVQFEASYTVTENDILAGEVLNVATATGTSPDPEVPEVPVTPGEDPEPTVDPDPSLKVVKTVTSKAKDGKAYAKGETITYKITVTNDGNLTISNVEVKDELTGDKWSIKALKPGESKDFTAKYTVADKDVTAGKVLNVATADGDNPTEDTDDPTPTRPGKGTNETPTKRNIPPYYPVIIPTPTPAPQPAPWHPTNASMGCGECFD